MMKTPLVYAFCLWFGLMSVPSVYACVNTQLESKADTIEYVELAAAELKDLQIPRLTYSFKANLEALGSVEDLKRQEAELKRLQNIFLELDTDKLTLCDKISFEKLKFEVELALERSALGQRFLAEGFDLESANTLSDVPFAHQWYKYFLKAWNGAELEPRVLIEFGEQQLQRSVREYEAIQLDLGYEEQADEFQNYIEDNSKKIDSTAEVRKLLQSKQKLILERLHILFSPKFHTNPATIKELPTGNGSPAIGLYDQSQSTFYYNMIDGVFERRQADWLVLHETIPGHHFQQTNRSEQYTCSNTELEFYYPAYVEGWAAYAETMGDELGLYETPLEKLAAIEWDMVRSARVVLDAGINGYGWTDEEALDYWHRRVIGNQDIADREIARIRRWPAQVVTYKYGADVFEGVRDQFIAEHGEMDNPKVFHNAILSLGEMPLPLLKTIMLDHSRNLAAGE